MRRHEPNRYEMPAKGQARRAYCARTVRGLTVCLRAPLYNVVTRDDGGRTPRGVPWDAVIANAQPEGSR
jgi:hypothetical protein